MDIDTLAGLFVPRTRGLGEVLYKQGRVQVLHVEADRVLADVQDGRSVRAYLDTRQASMAGHCTCTVFQRRYERCAHMWAAALAGRAGGTFLPPAWRRHLEALRRQRHRPGASVGNMRVLYVVDEPASRSLGRLHLRVMQARVGKDGKPGRLERLSTNARTVERLPDPVDRTIHTRLHGGTDSVSYLDTSRHDYTIPGALAPELLPTLCASGRFVREPGLVPLQFEAEQPWTLGIEVERGPADDLRVAGRLHRDTVSRTIDESVLALDGVVIEAGRVALLDAGGLWWWVREIGPAGFRVPGDELQALLGELLPAAHERVRLPADLELEEVRARPRPRLRVKAWRPRALAAALSFDYDGECVPAGEPGDVALAAGLKLILRDRQAESAAHADALAAGFHAPRARFLDAPELQLAPGRLPAAVRRLVTAGWVVEAEGKLYRTPGKIRFRVTSGVDWFDLQGSVDFEGQPVALPAVLAALRRGDGVVQLGDGTFGMLPEAWLARHQWLLGVGRTEGDGLRFERRQAALLDALLAEQGDVNVDAAFERARDRLARVDAVLPADPEPRFAGVLRVYQREGLGWLRFLEQLGMGGCLADDMGLGKTVQVLAHLAARPPGRTSLIVVPRSLVFNWREEAARFVPGLRVLDHGGPARARDAAGLAGYEVVLTTYGVLRRDISWIKDVPFDYAILDEAQAIKNADSDSAKAARLLRAEHRLALSGTPVENSLDDLLSLFEYLNPGMLGRSAAFAGAGRADVDDASRLPLARALRPFILRRTKRQVARDLPERVEQTLHCELDDAQRTAYDEVRDHYRRRLLGRTQEEGVRRSLFLVLEALLRLRQAACHSGLLDPSRAHEPCAKLDALLPLLEEVTSEGSKALVFSQFTSFLGILRRRLDERRIVYEYLDGQTTDRQQRVQRFQQDADCRVFLVSLKAGGLGLNLTAAEYVFLLDPWWNPAAEAQAIDRAHRIGQRRTVFAYRIVARDTIEEKVLALQETKRALAEAVVRADESILGELDHAELERLLS